MKIIIPANINPVEVIRRSGYGLIRDRRSGQDSFARRLGSGFYPRFHVYLDRTGGFFNLHLDQKQASYQGQTGHSGEYDGEVVEQEGERIRQIAAAIAVGRSGYLADDVKTANRNSGGFWSRFFKGL